MADAWWSDTGQTSKTSRTCLSGNLTRVSATNHRMVIVAALSPALCETRASKSRPCTGQGKETTAIADADVSFTLPGAGTAVLFRDASESLRLDGMPAMWYFASFRNHTT